MTQPFSGKSRRLTEEIYRVLKVQKRALTPYDVWRLMIPSYKKKREPFPARTVVARRAKVLAEKGFLKIVRTEMMPSGLVKKYYEPSEEFRSAKRLHDMNRRAELVDLLSETVRFDEGIPEEAERLLRKLKRR